MSHYEKKRTSLYHQQEKKSNYQNIEFIINESSSSREDINGKNNYE